MNSTVRCVLYKKSLINVYVRLQENVAFAELFKPAKIKCKRVLS